MRWTPGHQRSQDRALPSRASTHDRCCMHSAGSPRQRASCRLASRSSMPPAPPSETVRLQDLSANNPIIDAGMAVFLRHTRDKSF